MSWRDHMNARDRAEVDALGLEIRHYGAKLKAARKRITTISRRVAARIHRARKKEKSNEI